MVKHLAILLALRQHLTGTQVATTPAGLSMTGTTTGFTRATGSFIDDGFAVGMEVTPAGFPETAPVLITALTATAMTVRTTSARTPAAAGTGYSIVAALPSRRAWENVEYTPEDGEWYVDEQYLPGPLTLVSGNEDSGEYDAEPAYVLRLYGLSGTGASALYNVSGAVLDRFNPGRAIPTSDGHTVMVRSFPSPRRGQIMREGPGRAVVEVEIPAWVRTSNNAS